MSDNATPKKLSRPQKRALQVWFSLPSIAAIANYADVNPSTVHRWKRDEQFQQAIRELQGQTLADATARLVGEQDASINTLAELRDDPESPPQVRRGSARDLLEYAQRYVELQDLEARLSSLEEKIL